MLLSAARVWSGVVETLKELSGILEICRLPSFEESVGHEVSGTRPGIAYSDVQTFGRSGKQKLWAC